MSLRWGRLTALAACAVVGIGWVAILPASAPRILQMAAGVLGLAGVVATAALLIIAYSLVVDDLRPSLCFRKPRVPLSLSHNGAAMKGYRTFRNHPVRFWGGLALNHRFFVGFMVFDEPRFENLRLASGTEARRAETPESGSVHEGAAIAQPSAGSNSNEQ